MITSSGRQYIQHRARPLIQHVRIEMITLSSDARCSRSVRSPLTLGKHRLRLPDLVLEHGAPGYQTTIALDRRDIAKYPTIAAPIAGPIV